MKYSLVALACLSACLDSKEPVDPEPTSKRTISISTGVAPLLVAYREGTSGDWLAATKVSDAAYEARVGGAYSVMVVCAETVQITSWTLEDALMVKGYCAVPETPLTVTGTMKQPGRVTLGAATTASVNEDWTFTLRVPAGAADLVAVSTDRIYVQRSLAISSNLTLPAIDLSTQGTALVDAAFTATNPRAGEVLSAATLLVSPRLDPQAQIYRGAMTAVKVVPSSLLGGDLVQEVSLRAQLLAGARQSMRTSRRPFRVGDDTSVTFWDPLPGHAFLIDQGRATLSWASRAELDTLSLSVSASNGWSYSVSASKNYLTDTKLTKLAIDLEAPGFLASWRPNLGAEYQMSLFAQRLKPIVESYSAEDTFNVGALAQ